MDLFTFRLSEYKRTQIIKSMSFPSETTTEISGKDGARAILNLVRSLGTEIRQNGGSHLGSSMDTYSDFFKLVQRVMVGINRQNLWYILQDVMPLEITTAKSVEVEVTNHASRGRMRPVAEGGFALQMPHTIENRRVTLEAVGEFDTISLNLLATPEGQAQLTATLMIMARTFYMQTLPLYAFRAIMREALDSLGLVRVVRKEEYLMAVRSFIEDYACCNKAETGFASMVKRAKLDMRKKNGSVEPKYVICPHEKIDILLQRSARYGTHQGGGEAGAKRGYGGLVDLEFDGVKVGMAPQGTEEEWSREITTGTYVPIVRRLGMPAPAAGAPPPVDYDVRVRRYNGDNGTYETVSLSEAFKNSGLFESFEGRWRLKTASAQPGDSRYGVGQMFDPQNPNPPSPFVENLGGRWVLMSFVDAPAIPPIPAADVGRFPPPPAAAGAALPPGSGWHAIQYWLCPHGNWPGLSAIAFSPLYRQRMSPAILVAEGLGKTFQSEEVLCQSNNPQTMTHGIGFRAHCGALVTDPEKIRVVWDCFYDGSVRGADSRPVTDRLYYPSVEWKHDLSRGSIFYAVFPSLNGYSGMLQASWVDDKPLIHIRGQNPFDNSEIEEYPSSRYTAAYWGWDTIQNTAVVADSKSNIAPFCCLGSYKYMLESGQEVHVNGLSHHGPKEDEKGAEVRRYGMAVV